MGKTEKVIIEALHLKKGAKCLNLVSGNNKLMKELIKELGTSGEIWGLYNASSDVHRKSRERLIRFYENVRYYAASPLDIPANANYFDCVLAVEMLEGIDRDLLFHEVYRVLKPLGRLIIIDHPSFLGNIDVKTELLTLNYENILIQDFKKMVIGKRNLVEASKPL